MSEHVEWDLNELLKCCKRELQTRQRVYPKWVAKGYYTEKKANQELEAMRAVCDYFVDAIFFTVTRQAEAAPKRVEKS